MQSWVSASDNICNFEVWVFFFTTFICKYIHAPLKCEIYAKWGYFCSVFISKSRNKPVLTDLYEPNQEDLDYPELLRKCSEIEINISDKEIEIVEQGTRTPAKGPGFFRYRYRNCGLLNVTTHYPILTFIKRLQAEFE